MAKGMFKQETATVITITSQKTAYTKLCGSGSIWHLRTKPFQVFKSFYNLQNLNIFVRKHWA